MKNINLLMSVLSVFMFLTLGSCRQDKDLPVKPTEKAAEVCGEKSQEEKKEKKKEEEQRKRQEEEKKKREEEEERKKQEEEKRRKEEEEKQATEKKGKPFITSWWVGEDNTISIPLSKQYFDKYNYVVKWKNIDKPNLKGEVSVGGDDNVKKGVIELPEYGEYRLEIKGDFPAIFFHDSGYAENLRKIEQWGGIEWETMKGAFSGCKNLQITAKDAPDLSRVRDMSYMFEGAWNFNQSVNHWDVSNVAYMNGLFKDAERFNQPLDNWRVDNVKNMKEMFYNAKSFNQSLNSWNVNNVKNVDNMFYGAKLFDKKNINSWPSSAKK